MRKLFSRFIASNISKKTNTFLNAALQYQNSEYKKPIFQSQNFKFDKQEVALSNSLTVPSADQKKIDMSFAIVYLNMEPIALKTL